MALNAVTLAALAKAKLLADESSGAVDNASLEALCKAMAEATVEHIAVAAVVTFPPSAIVVAGSATTQTNAAPCTGGTVA